MCGYLGVLMHYDELLVHYLDVLSVIISLFCLMVFSFGVRPSNEKQFHEGVMHTKVDDCQFICIPQLEYNRILHEVIL